MIFKEFADNNQIVIVPISNPEKDDWKCDNKQSNKTGVYMMEYMGIYVDVSC